MVCVHKVTCPIRSAANPTDAPGASSVLPSGVVVPMLTSSRLAYASNQHARFYTQSASDASRTCHLTTVNSWPHHISCRHSRHVSQPVLTALSATPASHTPTSSDTGSSALSNSGSSTAPSLRASQLPLSVAATARNHSHIEAAQTAASEQHSSNGNSPAGSQGQSAALTYKRVMLKISGEALQGAQGFGIDPVVRWGGAGDQRSGGRTSQDPHMSSAPDVCSCMCIDRVMGQHS